MEVSQRSLAKIFEIVEDLRKRSLGLVTSLGMKKSMYDEKIKASAVANGLNELSDMLIDIAGQK